MYKIETHMHTRPVSFCAYLEPEEMIALHAEHGYNTVFVSDHFAINHFARLGDLTWQEKTGLMYESYLKAKAAGEKAGITVLFSPELTLEGNHYLLYNADLDFLNSREDFFYITMEEFHEYAVEKDVSIIQAHPLRDGKCVPKPQYVIGFEAINSNPRHENFDEESLRFAKESGLLITAGSDAHRLEDVGGAAVLSPFEIKSADDYLNLLKSGQAQLMHHGRIISLE